MRSGETELAWAAGFYDGEGSMYAKANPSGRAYPRIQVSQTRIEPIQRWHEAVELGRVVGPYRRTPAHEPTIWLCTASGRESLKIFSALTPFLSIPKIEQAQRVLTRCCDYRFVSEGAFASEDDPFLDEVMAALAALQADLATL